jgi:hypothetical protein
MNYFSTAADDDEASLKAVLAALANPSYETWVKVDQLLYVYFELIRHGETRHLSKNIEWVLFESAVGRILISYKDGSEWVDEAMSEEVPKWLLNAILRQIQRRKPLGDVKADEVLKEVRDVETEYINNKNRVSARGIKLNTRRFVEEGLYD